MKTVLITFTLFTLLWNLTSSDLLLVGGGLEDANEEIWRGFIDIAGGSGVAKIGCITTASADPEDSGIYYEDMFKSYGAASATYIPVTETSNNADTSEIENLVKEQTGFFFGGGDQARIIEAWIRPDGTEMERTSYDSSNPDNLYYIEDGGLGNLVDFVVDTHYSERGREGRMIELLLDTNKDFAIGIDENTGVRIAQDGSAEILGAAGGAMVIDMRNAVRSHTAPTTVTDVVISFYTEDDKFNIYDGSANYASWKSNLEGNEYYNNAISSDNIFSSPDKPDREYSVFRDTAHRLWDSKDSSVTSYTYEDGPTFSITMRKASGTAYGGYSPVDDSFQVSYERMVVDIDYS